MGAWLLVLLLAAPAGAPVGLRARLTLVDAQPALGQPIRLRLELTNAGATRITYDAEQVPHSDVLEVRGPDGKLAPHVNEWVQTAERETPLDPGRTAVLFDGFDLAEHYHLVASGRYRVHFSGRGLELSGNAPPPTSNVVEIELRPGRLPQVAEVVERLLPVLPKGWTLSRSVRSGMIEVVLTGLVRSNDDHARVTLSLTDTPPNSVARPWGRTVWGSLWAMANPRARKAWPDHRKAIARALAVRP